MSRWNVHFTALAALIAGSVQAQPPISQDRELLAYDLSAWDCMNRAAGSAKTPDGVERSERKNRPPIDVTAVVATNFNTAEFLQHVSAFDVNAKGKRRKDLDVAQREQLQALENQVVSLTAYLGLAYSGPPESTNCGSVDLHDWHLEMFERALDHAPRPGDPTPIICEITPRTQNVIFESGIRIQKLAGFFRRADLETEPTGQKPQRLRITGLLLWDDDHNGAADVGPTVRSVGKNKYHNPWRSTAWEIHPVLKVEHLDGEPPAENGPEAARVSTGNAAAVAAR